MQRPWGGMHGWTVWLEQREQETIWNRLRNLTLISRVIRGLLSREMGSDPFENDQVATKGRAGGIEGRRHRKRPSINT